MKRILLLVMMTVLFVGMGNVNKEEIQREINIKVLEYRRLEKMKSLSDSGRNKFYELEEDIRKYDNSIYGKMGRMSTHKEIDELIAKATFINQKNANQKPVQKVEKSKAVATATQVRKPKEPAKKEPDKSEKSNLSDTDKKAIKTIVGDVSHYGYNLHGSKTATGGTFNQWGMTAAHKTLPFGTVVRVTNTKNNKSVVVRINDRGPYIKGRVLDLSRGAFLKIAPQKQGIIKAFNVKIEVLSLGNGKRKENR